VPGALSSVCPGMFVLPQKLVNFWFLTQFQSRFGVL
jgi:hypothetical protein